MQRGAMVTLAVLACALGACHAHQVASARQSMDKPPTQAQVSSERPVRTTPGGMLDERAVHQIQDALTRHGEQAPSSGQLDDATQAALRRFQRRERIAATGMADYDTLRRLGLDPKAIYLGGTARRDRQRHRAAR